MTKQTQIHQHFYSTMRVEQYRIEQNVFYLRFTHFSLKTKLFFTFLYPHVSPRKHPTRGGPGLRNKWLSNSGYQPVFLKGPITNRNNLQAFIQKSKTIFIIYYSIYLLQTAKGHNENQTTLQFLLPKRKGKEKAACANVTGAISSQHQQILQNQCLLYS